MAGTYNIEENLTDSAKFRAMVSFNGKKAEYWESDESDPELLKTAIQLAADQDVIMNSTPEILEVEIKDGQIIA